MGIIDAIIGLVSVRRRGRPDQGLELLAREGELVPATIYAIRVAGLPGGDEWTYGLDMVTSAGALRASVRQTLSPGASRAQLGSRVLARHLGGRVAIDWPATLAEAGAEPETGPLVAGETLETTLEPGIDDDRISRERLSKGRRVKALVLACDPLEDPAAGDPPCRLQLRIEDPRSPRTVVLEREHVPPYAAGLAVVGSRLPIAVHPQRPNLITIDWPAAAEAVAATDPRRERQREWHFDP